MAPIPSKASCWLCDNAVWALPLWTWLVVLGTGAYVFGMLQPGSLALWFAIMGSLLVPIGSAIAVLMDENRRDRSRLLVKERAASLPAKPGVVAISK